MANKGKCGCHIIVGSFRLGEEASFPLNRAGWAAAYGYASRVADERPIGSLTLVDLACNDGRIALYQCARWKKNGAAICGIETPGAVDSMDKPTLAGRRR